MLNREHLGRHQRLTLKHPTTQNHGSFSKLFSPTMAVLRTLTPLAALVAYAEARAFAYSNVGDLLARGPQSCDSDIPMSCHNTTVVEDTCCFIPQGQLLQTQFWDTDPVTGPTGKSRLN